MHAVKALNRLSLTLKGSLAHTHRFAVQIAKSESAMSHIFTPLVRHHHMHCRTGARCRGCFIGQMWNPKKRISPKVHLVAATAIAARPRIKNLTKCGTSFIFFYELANFFFLLANFFFSLFPT